jgi:hypothetical protein
LTALGLASIALQGFRAQYVALLCGMLVLLAWRLGELERGRRGLLLGLAVVAFAGFLVSPVGQRALTSYGELRASSGNVGYRLRLIEETSQGWSVFGAGVSAGVIPQDVTFDLGVPNTLIALGFVGAGLQLALLAAGFLRSLSAQTLAGATLAAIFALEIVARPSLPELESGPGALTAGVAVGFACALSVRRGPRYT